MHSYNRLVNPLGWRVEEAEAAKEVLASVETVRRQSLTFSLEKPYLSIKLAEILVKISIKLAETSIE